MRNKKHWVEYTATIFGSILVEGDESPQEASDYVKSNLGFFSTAEGIAGEINEQQIVIDHVYEAKKDDL